jgi:hypothetical protein
MRVDSNKGGTQEGLLSTVASLYSKIQPFLPIVFANVVISNHEK